MTTELLRRLFTVNEYTQMAEAGILTEDDRLELIQGEIVQMSPIGRRHAAVVNRLVRLLTQYLGNRVILSPQNPVQLNDYSQPQPDIALLKPRADFYEARHPQPADILLLIEVADTTVLADRTVKIPLYAQNSILEVWLVNLESQCLEVYDQPSQQRYQHLQTLAPGQTIPIQAFPEVMLKIEDILGS